MRLRTALLMAEPGDAPPGGGGTDPGASAVPPSTPDWGTLVSTLPPELQANPTVKNLKDFPGTIKQLVDAQTYNVGAIKVPTLDAGADAWRSVYRKLGMPETHEGYTVPDGAIPEGVTLDPGLRDWFFKSAHEAGLSTQQVHSMLRSHLDRTHGQQQEAILAHQQHLRDVEQGVRTKYGAATDRLMTLGIRAAQYFADEETQTALTEGGVNTFLGMFGQAPWLIDAMIQMGQQMAEDHLITGDVQGAPGPDAALAEWTAIQGNPQHAYWQAQNPAHDEAVRRVAELFQVMAGGR